MTKEELAIFRRLNGIDKLEEKIEQLTNENGRLNYEIEEICYQNNKIKEKFNNLIDLFWNMEKL